MKYAIYGAGSLGTVLGAYITKGGESIDLINRNEDHISALNLNGAEIIGEESFNQKVKGILDKDIKEIYDIIFLVTKQQENRKVVGMLKNHLAEDGVIVTLQNGIPEPLIGEIIGENRVIGCTVGWGATLISPGVVSLTSGKDTFVFTIGTLNKYNNPKMDEVKRLLSLMGTVIIDDNFLGSRWSKLLVNSAFSAMSAALGLTFGEVSKNKKSRKYVQYLIKEAIDVGLANNIKIEPIQGKDIVKLMNYHSKFKKLISFMIIPLAMKKHKKLKASMLQDLEKGKKCEIEAINGVIVSFGKKANVKTPYNEKIIEIVRKIENNEISYSIENLKYFREIE